MSRRSLAFGALLLFVPALAWAQAVGEIVGTVSDPTGAVIPNATVTALQKATGLTRSTITSGAGTYSLPKLPVGSYQVTSQASGFKVAGSDISLDVNQQREVNFTLALAGSTTEVAVTAAPPLLTTTNATLGGLVSGQQVVSLPLNGRDITNLVLLQPGVQQEVNSSFPFLNFVAGNGNRGTTGSSYMDNIDTSDNELGGAQFSNFNLDAIAEFRVLQNNYSAEYGRGSGAIVHLVSKSGNNEFHGSLFEFVRNSAFDSRNFFTSKVPPFRRNEFGATFGGPVHIPGVYSGKDRTFFFAQYAGFRQRRGSPGIFTVPTANERKGIVDFICVPPPSGSCRGNPGPDQYIVPVNPTIQTILNAYPSPNLPGTVNNFEGTASLPVTRDQWSTRLDHRFSEKDSIFGRYTFSNNHLLPDTLNTIENPTFSAHVRNDQRNLGITETRIVSPTFLNTLRLGYTLTDEFIGPGSQTVTANTFSDGALAYYGPDITIFDLHPETFTVNDGINWTKGRHTISAGGEYRRIRDDEFGASVGGPNGFFQFAPTTPLPVAVPSASGTNNIPAGGLPVISTSLLSFMEAAAQFYQRTLAFPGFGPAGGGFAPFGIRRSHEAGWFQDDIKWSRKLTLNLGVRYEYNTVPTEVAGRLSGIVDDPHFLNGTVYRKLLLNPDPIYYPDYRGWGPRFGFAYKLQEKTVLRGGYGVFTNLPLTQTADQQAFNFPFASTASILNPPYSLTPLPVAGLPTLTDLQGNPLPPGGDTHKVPKNTPVNLVPVQTYFGGPLLTNLSSMNLRNGYTMAGNLTLERQLPADVIFQVGYVTNSAAKLYASEWPNGYNGALPQFNTYSLADPGLGEFQLTDNHAHSTYHSLQAMVRKVSPTHGIQFQGSYTYSRSIDNATTVFNGPGSNSAVLQNNPFCWRCEKAVSSFDFPHRFVLNFIYELPLDKWQAASFLPRRLAQGWQVTSILQAQSGFPFTVNTPYSTVAYGNDVYAGGGNVRPDLIQQPTFHTGGGTEEQFFSDAMIADSNNLTQLFFAAPGAILNGKTTGLPQNNPGNLGRNTFRTHSYSNVDFSVVKETRLTERGTLEFRGEFFNLFNQHAFGQPASTYGGAGFGVATSTVLSERQIQFGLRLIF
jgi:carboxypeptidase family protein/TonB-dependent receptor-like protein